MKASKKDAFLLYVFDRFTTIFGNFNIIAHYVSFQIYIEK